MWGCDVPHYLKENNIHYSVMILKSVSPGYHFNKNALSYRSYISVFAYWTSTSKWASSFSSNRVERCINSSLITSALSSLSIFLYYLMLNHHCTINTLREEKSVRRKECGNKKVQNSLVRNWTSFALMNSALTRKTLMMH